MNAPCTELTASLVAARGFGVLDEAEGKKLEEHLGSCEPCRALVVEIETSLDEVAVAPETAPDVWEGIEKKLDRLEGKVPAVTLSCTYCKDRLDRETAVFCAGCLAPHHGECFSEHGRCAACREVRFVHPSGRPVSRLRQAAALGIVFLPLAGVVAALTYYEAYRPRPLAKVPERKAPAEAAPVEAAPAVPPPARLVRIDADDLPLESVLALLNAQDPELRAFTNAGATRVTFHRSDLPWRETLDALARAAGGEVWNVENFADALLVDVEPRVTISSSQMSVADVASRLAAVGKKQLVLGPDLTKTLPIDIHNVTWSGALEAIARSAKLNVEREGDVVVLSSHTLDWGSQNLDQAEARLWSVARDDATSVPRAITRRESPCRDRVRAEGVQVGAWARLLAGAEGRSVIVPPGTEGSVTLDLVDIPLASALRVGLGVNDLGIVADREECLRVTSLELSRSNRWAPGESLPVETTAKVHPFELRDLRERGQPLRAVVVDREGKRPPRAVIVSEVVKVGDILGTPEVGLEVVGIDEESVDVARTDTGSRRTFRFSRWERGWDESGPVVPLAPEEDAALVQLAAAKVAEFETIAPSGTTMSARLDLAAEIVRLVERRLRHVPPMSRFTPVYGSRLHEVVYGANRSDMDRRVAEIALAELARHLDEKDAAQAREDADDARSAIERLDEQPGWRKLGLVLLARLKALTEGDGYEKALAHARASGRRLLVAFSGHASANCREMEATVLAAPRVREALGKLEVATLFVDADTPEEKANLRTETNHFGGPVVPAYYVVDPVSGRKLAELIGTCSEDAFLEFLSLGTSR